MKYCPECGSKSILVYKLIEEDGVVSESYSCQKCSAIGRCLVYRGREND